MSESCRKVVVTGMGAVTPFGVGVAPLWNGVSGARSGIDWIKSLGDLDPENYPVRMRAKSGTSTSISSWQNIARSVTRKASRWGWSQPRRRWPRPDCSTTPLRSVGTRTQLPCLGEAQGACHELELPYEAFFTHGPRAVRPTTVPKAMFNSLSSQLSIHFGLTGPNHVIASACTSGSAAIGLGTLFIRQRLADIVLCGGAEAPLTPVMFTCWTNMRVLARHSEPQKASRPFDAKRNGLVLGEGAAMVVLESQESAERRGVVPLARVLGYGTSSDAHHITSPTVTGQVAAMQNCLADARIKPEQVDYINLHGTATKANDETEATAVAEVFGRRGKDMPSSSTKSMLGHSLGASGAIEFAICVEAMRQGFVPPTINCEEPDPNLGLDYVPLTGREHLVRLAMSNSFAFGGNNACLLLGRDE